MTPVFALIGSAWKFFQKHPVLNQVLGVMIFLPLLLLVLTGTLLGRQSETLLQKLEQGLAIMPEDVPPEMIPTALALFVLFLWLLWGNACVLTVGNRLIKSQAGRAKTSFKATCKQARHFIIPIFLTSIIRGAITIALVIPGIVLIVILEGMGKVVPGWFEILLLFPSIVYQLRTMLYQVVIVCDRKEYFAALTKSGKAIGEHGAMAYTQLIGIIFWTAIVPSVIFALAQELLLTFDQRLMLVTLVMDAMVSSVIVVLMMLSLIAFYGSLKKQKKAATLPVTNS